MSNRTPEDQLEKIVSKRRFHRRSPFLDKVHHMEVKDDDVWVVTLPKCGTTWMQELVWLVMHDYDFEAAKSEHLEIRTPFLEFNFIIHRNPETALKPVEDLASPRLIKSHLSLPLLPAQLWQKKPKVIYVYRNPKDAMVSMYYHEVSLGPALNTSADDFISARMEQMDFEHVTEFYALRHEPWLYYTSFEYMKKNLRQVILDICAFLNKSITETQMLQMLEHLSFASMRDNPKTNHHWEFEQSRRVINLPYEPQNFIRKGQVGGYKDDLKPATIARMDRWIAKQLAHHNVTLDELLLMNDKRS